MGDLALMILGAVALFALIYSWEQRDRKRDTQIQAAAEDLASAHRKAAHGLISSTREAARNGDSLSSLRLGLTCIGKHGIRYRFSTSALPRRPQRLSEIDLDICTSLLDPNEGADLLEQAATAGRPEAIRALRKHASARGDRERLLRVNSLEKNRERMENSTWAEPVIGMNDASAYFPASRSYPTKRGHCVRSKAEQYIADSLHALKIPYFYERPWFEYDQRPLRRTGANQHHQRTYRPVPARKRLPDFTILTPDDRWIIWEHLGLMDRPEYRTEWHEKAQFYARQHFVEGESLFATESWEDVDRALRTIFATVWPGYRYPGFPLSNATSGDLSAHPNRNEPKLRDNARGEAAGRGRGHDQHIGQPIPSSASARISLHTSQRPLPLLKFSNGLLVMTVSRLKENGEEQIIAEAEKRGVVIHRPAIRCTGTVVDISDSCVGISLSEGADGHVDIHPAQVTGENDELVVAVGDPLRLAVFRYSSP